MGHTLRSRVGEMLASPRASGGRFLAGRRDLPEGARAQPVVVAVIVIAILWRVAIATWCVSVRLADFGPIFVVLKFPTCPVMAFLIWEKGDRFGAALALLWPIAVLLIQQLLNTWGFIATAFARRNVFQAELDVIRDRFKARLSM
jgi:hypothetical protein